MTNISELRAECARESIIQKKIAEITEKTEATISRIFNGEAEFSLADATKISNELNLSYEKRGFIFLGTDLTKL